MKKSFLTFALSSCAAYIILLSSCTAPKNVIYFQNIHKDTSLRNLVDNNFELKIRKNDLLSINIISPDPISTPLFNGSQSFSTTSMAESGVNTSGYLVDNRGNIEIYKLGPIYVEGLTRNELKQKLQKALVPYLKDAVITVTFLNNRVTMLGEVGKPQVLTMPSEQLTILEAIGLSGDLTITGRRDNILVIRETTAGKQFKRINLTDNSIFYSPFFNLRPGDVVYVEPTKFKINNNQAQTYSYLLSALSILITLLVYIIPRN